ncbi:MAG: 6-hydroxycyclohex-1-ene-1-carbonyl-CoA dehydrogenase [Myxococcales bacterium]|nr:6-hydroxycyclohex-1-ene-1-carbonyl-CoA dehydrogenase [Myxococcales bacterium]
MMSEPISCQCWELRSPGEALEPATREIPLPGADQVVVEVAGCGICHTDLGYIFDGVKPRHDLPLTLGHEIAGVVKQAGANYSDLAGKSVVVPAVIPCGSCELCKDDRGGICKSQIFPGCDVHGGFASHVLIPAAGLCTVDEDALTRSEVELADLAVLGDAVTTAYQAIVRSELREDDVAIFVGAGGVGSFGVQIASSFGAHVIALDIDDERLARCAEYGAHHTINVRDQEPKAIRKAIRGYVKENSLRDTRWKIYETSGAAAGQTLAFSLLTYGAVLGVVGYTMESVKVRLSNLMAFDAQAQGTWGCLPKHYPAVLDLVLSGKVKVKPFVQRMPMSKVNDAIGGLKDHTLSLRPVLIPDF